MHRIAGRAAASIPHLLRAPTVPELTASAHAANNERRSDAAVVAHGTQDVSGDESDNEWPRVTIWMTSPESLEGSSYIFVVWNAEYSWW